MKNIVCAPKRMIFARFDEGDDLLLSLKSCAAEYGIKSGWFNLIGGLKEFAYGLYEQGAYGRTFDPKTNLWPIKF